MSGFGKVHGISLKLLIWRLKNPPSLNIGGNSVLELVHQEKFLLKPSSPFLPQECFVGGKYIATIHVRQLHNKIESHELLIEVRSTADFSVVYSTKERTTGYYCFSFHNDILAVQIFQNHENCIRYKAANE